MAEPNIFIVDTNDPSKVKGVVSDEVAPATEPEPHANDEDVTDATENQTAPRPRKN